jgi:acetyl esterase/lipase
MAANPGLDILSLRAILDVMHELATEPADVTYQEISAAGQRALWINPIGAAEDRVILFLHGGGFIAGSINCHRKLAAHLAKATGCRALVPAYRLAPENPFPAQLDDALGIYQWLLKEGFDPSHIATAGDSAGGNLATSLCLRTQAEDLPFPAAIIGISPWLDMEANGWTLDTNAGRSAEMKPRCKGSSRNTSSVLHSARRWCSTGTPQQLKHRRRSNERATSEFSDGLINS